MKNTLLLSLSALLFSCAQEPPTTNIQKNLEADTTNHFLVRIDALTTQLKTDSLNAALYFERAELYLKSKSLNPGASDLLRAVKLDSTNALYWQQLGTLHYAMKNSRFAKNAWEECANLDSRNIDCRLSLAEIYLAVGELKKGQEKINEVLNFDAKNADALYLSGNYALMKADTVKAIKYIQASINQQQDFFKAYDLMGVLYSAKGDLLALDYFNSALRLQPNRFDIHYKVGMFYQKLGAYDDAILAYERALVINTEHKISMHNIAVLHVFMGDNNEALDVFTKALAIDDMYLEAYFGRAYTYELLGEIANAESDYRTALMLDPAYSPAIDGLARIGK